MYSCITHNPNNEVFIVNILFLILFYKLSDESNDKSVEDNRSNRHPSIVSMLIVSVASLIVIITCLVGVLLNNMCGL